jgi:hypothetical protein
MPTHSPIDSTQATPTPTCASRIAVRGHLRCARLAHDESLPDRG